MPVDWQARNQVQHESLLKRRIVDCKYQTRQEKKKKKKPHNQPRFEAFQEVFAAAAVVVVVVESRHQSRLFNIVQYEILQITDAQTKSGLSFKVRDRLCCSMQNISSCFLSFSVVSSRTNINHISYSQSVVAEKKRKKEKYKSSCVNWHENISLWNDLALLG